MVCAYQRAAATGTLSRFTEAGNNALMRGPLPENAADMARLYPDLWPTESSAKNWVRGDGGTQSGSERRRSSMPSKSSSTCSRSYGLRGESALPRPWESITPQDRQLVQMNK